MPLKQRFRKVGLAIARALGTNIVDAHTGRPLGKAFVFAWRGKIHIIGLDAAVRPEFLPQRRITYWKQEIGFTVHPPPNFDRISRAEMSETPEARYPTT